MKPMGVQVAGPETHRPVDEMSFVGIIGVGQSMIDAPQPDEQADSDQQQDEDGLFIPEISQRCIPSVFPRG